MKTFTPKQNGMRFIALMLSLIIINQDVLALAITLRKDNSQNTNKEWVSPAGLPAYALESNEIPVQDQANELAAPKQVQRMAKATS